MAKPKGQYMAEKEAIQKGTWRPTAEEKGQYFRDNGQ
jgi:hypothetical protein